jgi:hypothetical protein
VHAPPARRSCCILIAHTLTPVTALLIGQDNSPGRRNQISGNFQLEWADPNRAGVAAFGRGGVVSVPTNRQGSSEGLRKTASNGSATPSAVITSASVRISEF